MIGIFELGHPVGVRLSLYPLVRGCSLRSYPRLPSGDASSVGIGLLSPWVLLILRLSP